VTVDPDGRHLVCLDGGKTVVRLLGDGRETFATEEGRLMTYSQSLSSDGRVLAQGSFQQIDLWDPSTGKSLGRLEYAQPNVSAIRLEFRPGRNHLASAWGQGSSANDLIVWDLETRKPVRSVELEETRAFKYDPSGDYLVTGHEDGSVRILDASTIQPRRILRGHRGPVNEVAVSPDGRLIASVGVDGSTRLWSPASGDLIATMLAMGTDDFLIATPDHYYLNSKRGLETVAFRQGMRMFPFEQFDLRFNRPDVVLQRIGYASPDLIESYRTGYERRLGKLGLTEDQLTSDYHVPSLRIANRKELPLATKQPKITLDIRALDDKYDLRRLLVYINESPLNGLEGIRLPKGKRQLRTSIEVPLGSGPNRIHVSTVNGRGAESLRDVVELSCLRESEKPKLYLLAIGVSDYQRDSLDLRYAAKDAKDLVAAFAKRARAAGRSPVYGEVKALTLVDERATRQNILAAKKFLGQASYDDHVVIFLAGHGFLDSRLDFYFGTTDIDPGDPPKRGIRFEKLESLMDGLKSRHKLVLIDSCHSGEIESAGSEPVARTQVADGVVSVRGAFLSAMPEGPASNTKGIGLANSFAVSRATFANLERRTGATVISSASGLEFALESPRWQNGVFTYSILQGLESGGADADNDGVVTVRELGAYVGARVKTLTQGRQAPMVRHENLIDDFPVLEVSRPGP
jgi:hypothetical protein